MSDPPENKEPGDNGLPTGAGEQPTPRKRGGQPGHLKHGGRQKGQRNLVPLDARIFARNLVDSPRYQAYVRKRLLAGTLPAEIEKMLWGYAKGKPTERFEVSGPDGQPLAQLETGAIRDRLVILLGLAPADLELAHRAAQLRLQAPQEPAAAPAIDVEPVQAAPAAPAPYRRTWAEGYRAPLTGEPKGTGKVEPLPVEPGDFEEVE